MGIARHTPSSEAPLSAAPDRSGTRKALGPKGDPVSWNSLVGPTLAELTQSGTEVPLPIRLRIIFDTVLAIAERHENSEASSLLRFQGHVTPVDIIVGLNGVAQVRSVPRDFRKAKLPPQPRRGYLAPELLLRKYPASRATDVFSLGVCLWESLVRVRLFPESKAQLLFDRIRSHELPVLKDLPSEAWALLMVAEKAFSYHPKNRYESANQMLADMYHAAGNLLASHFDVANCVQQTTGLAPKFLDLQADFSNDGPPTEISDRCAAEVHPAPVSLPKPPPLPSLPEMEALSGLVFTKKATRLSPPPAIASASNLPQLVERGSDLPTLEPGHPERLDPGQTPSEPIPEGARGELTTIAETSLDAVLDVEDPLGSAAASHKLSSSLTAKRIAWAEVEPQKRSGLTGQATATHALTTQPSQQHLAAALAVACTFALLVITLWLLTG